VRTLSKRCFKPRPLTLTLPHTGGVEDSCKIDGSYYTQLCGDRQNPALNLVSDAEWRVTYTKHRNFDPETMQNWAGEFAKRAAEEGGAGGSNLGFVMDNIAQEWFQRDELLDPEDQAAMFHRRICQAMRGVHPRDTGPTYDIYPAGSLDRLTANFMYDQCKQEQH
jgi:hypothetical protein